MKNPLLQHRSPACVRVDGPGVTHSTWRLATVHVLPKISRSFRLSNDLITIKRVHGGIAVPVEHNRGDSASGPTRSTRSLCGWRRPALLHGRKGGRHVAGSPAGQPGMDADRGIQV